MLLMFLDDHSNDTTKSVTILYNLIQPIHSNTLFFFSADFDRFRAQSLHCKAIWQPAFHQRFQGLVELMSSSQTSPQTNKFQIQAQVDCVHVQLYSLLEGLYSSGQYISFLDTDLFLKET